jgi:hypothetical protein
MSFSGSADYPRAMLGLDDERRGAPVFLILDGGAHVRPSLRLRTGVGSSPLVCQPPAGLPLVGSLQVAQEPRVLGHPRKCVHCALGIRVGGYTSVAKERVYLGLGLR